MIRSRLKIKANKSKNTSDIAKFERQRNLVATTVLILDKHAPKKTKTCARIKNHIFLRTFGSK